MNRFFRLWSHSAVPSATGWTPFHRLALVLGSLCLSGTGSSTAQDATAPGGAAAVSGNGGGGGGRDFASPRIGRSGLPFDQLWGGYDATPDGGPGLVPGRLDTGAIREGFSADLGSSITYSTNLFQDPVDVESGLLSSSDLSMHYHRGENRRLGVFFGIDYDMAYFRYFDDELNEDREPFEHNFSGFMGVKGAKTTLTLSGSAVQNNGNGINQARQQQETLQSQSTDYNLALSASRKLRRTSISAGLSFGLQDFTDQDETDGTVDGPPDRLQDLTQWDGNLGWAITPLRMPLVDFRPTVSFGISEQAVGSEQSYVNPSLGVAYTYDPKLAFFGSFGADIRHTTTALEEGGEESFTQTAPTFDLGVSWQVDPTTSLSVRVYRSTQASVLQGQSSSDTTGISLSAGKAFPRGFSTSIDYSFEKSSYTDSQGEEDTAAVGGTGTPENYHRFGVSVGRQKMLRGSMPLSASLFYQYNLSAGSDPLSEFDQSVVGFRLGLGF